MTIPARRLGAACMAVFLSAGMLPAQTANQSSAQSPYYGSVTIVKPTDGVKPLTIDEAIGMGIEHNLALVEAREQEQSAKAQSLAEPAVSLADRNGSGRFECPPDQSGSPGIFHESPGEIRSPLS